MENVQKHDNCINISSQILDFINQRNNDHNKNNNNGNDDNI